MENLWTHGDYPKELKEQPAENLFTVQQQREINYNLNFSELRDELLQLNLATIGFILLYACIVRGDELMLLSVDFIRYLFGAQSSAPLKLDNNRGDTWGG
ncbi:hypothetical protein J5N97_012574 [Dioscorea zingiberensis]|uniref:Uncharacterized protein n=1 Tax=Dioscorea zingiberensis TaxID=325984 RepID=A0A9D5HHV5_9LILI|nr:hypothetical protein J5N97_012574 [Dioscorea zingiberensis]